MEKSLYYRENTRLPLAGKLSVVVRQKIYDYFYIWTKPTPEMKVLDLGVTCDDIHDQSNYLEQKYPHLNNLTCAGIEDARHLEQKYPGVKFVRIAPNKRLPFKDKQFDVGHSNAVLEHAGTKEMQRFFLNELTRVSKRVFIALPNRLFPIEHHTGVPFLHWLPQKLFRGFLRLINKKYYAEESNLNLFFFWQLKKLLPKDTQYHLHFTGVGFSIFKSNIILTIDKIDS